jgi:hypothetical protein
MRSRIIVVVAALGAAGVVVAVPRGARGQGAEPVEVLPSLPTPPYAKPPPPDAEVPRLLDRTALTLDGGELALGVLAFAYGVTDWLSVGIAPPFWLIRTAAHVFVPNFNVKAVAYRSENLWISGTAGFYYAFVGNGANASGTLATVPLSAFASYQAVPGFWIHPEVTYVFVEGNGTGNYNRFTLGGTATTRTAQLGLMLQYQLTDVVSLTLWGRYEPYTGSVAVNGSGAIDAFTTASAEMRVTPGVIHPFAVVPGAAFLWRHWRFQVGVGYGNYFLPGMDISVRGAGFVPDANIYYVL